MLEFVDNLENVFKIRPLKSLSGLDIPILKITDEEVN